MSLTHSMKLPLTPARQQYFESFFPSDNQRFRISRSTPFYNISHDTYNISHDTYNISHDTYNISHDTYNISHT
jgi:hypothetical protein